MYGYCNNFELECDDCDAVPSGQPASEPNCFSSGTVYHIDFTHTKDGRLISRTFSKVLFPDRKFTEACTGPATCTVCREFPNYAFVTGQMDNLEQTSPNADDLANWLLDSDTDMTILPMIYTVEHPVRGRYYASRLDNFGTTAFVKTGDKENPIMTRHISANDSAYMTAEQPLLDFILQTVYDDPEHIRNVLDQFQASEFCDRTGFNYPWQEINGIPEGKTPDMQLLNDALDCGFIQIKQMYTANQHDCGKQTRCAAIGNILRSADFSLIELKELAQWFTRCNQASDAYIRNMITKGRLSKDIIKYHQIHQELENMLHS